MQRRKPSFTSDPIVPNGKTRRPSTPHPGAKKNLPTRVSVQPKGPKARYLSTATRVSLQLADGRGNVVFPTLVMTTYACPSLDEPIKVCLLGNPKFQELFLGNPNWTRSAQGNYWTTKKEDKSETMRSREREFQIYPWMDASVDPRTFFQKAAILLFFSKEGQEEDKVPQKTIKRHCAINCFLNLKLGINQFGVEIVDDFKISESQSLHPLQAGIMQSQIFDYIYRHAMIPPVEGEGERVNRIVPEQKASPAASTQINPSPPSSGRPTIRLEQPAEQAASRRKKCFS